jgi:hypothetical protein
MIREAYIDIAQAELTKSTQNKAERKIANECAINQGRDPSGVILGLQISDQTIGLLRMLHYNL